MVRYESTKQLTIEDFKTPFQQKLLTNNRWVKLSKIVPWDRFASIYMVVMDKVMGRPGLSTRIVLGALIIKHLRKLDDRGTIEEIQENPYMQYFLGLKEFIVKPSLFVEIRKRIGKESFDELNEMLIKSATRRENEKHKRDPKKKGKAGTKPRTYRRELDKAYLGYSKKRRKGGGVIRKMKRKMLDSVSRDLSHMDKMLDYFEGLGMVFPLNERELRYFWIIRTV